MSHIESKSQYKQQIISAIDENNAVLLQELLSNEKKANIFLEGGITAIYYAAYKGQSDCVRVLIQKGADPGFCDVDGWSAFFWAAWNGLHDCLPAILSRVANINCIDNQKRTPLYLAAWRGHAQCVKILTEYHANVDSGDYLGKTPLTMAIRENHTQCVKLLLKAGANPNKQDTKGRYPLDIAKERKLSECEELVLDAGGINRSILRERAERTKRKRYGIEKMGLECARALVVILMLVLFYCLQKNIDINRGVIKLIKYIGPFVILAIFGIIKACVR